MAKGLPFEVRVGAGLAVVLLFQCSQPLILSEVFVLFMVGYTSLSLFDLIVVFRSTGG